MPAAVRIEVPNHVVKWAMNLGQFQAEYDKL
jgi:hypothetical protein